MKNLEVFLDWTIKDQKNEVEKNLESKEAEIPPAIMTIGEPFN